MKLIKVLLVSTLISGPAFSGEAALRNPLTDSESWQDLRYDIVGDAEIADGSALFSVDAPYRAHDAATVPIVIKQTDPDRQIEKATIVIDENPAMNPDGKTIRFGIKNLEVNAARLSETRGN